MLRAFTILLVIALPLAGCLGKDEPLDTASVATNASAATNATSASASATGALDNATSVAAPVAVPISYAGSTPEGACVFVAGQCQWTQAGSEDDHAIDFTGTAKRIVVNITYGEQHPGFTFYVALCRGEGVDEGGVECPDYQTAPSPIVLDVDLSADPAGTKYGLSVGSVNDAGASAGAGMLFGAAEFSVDGAILVVK